MKNNNDKWMILVNHNMYGTDNPERRITRNKSKATKFNDFIEAKWRSECIEYENRDKPHWRVRVVKCR